MGIAYTPTSTDPRQADCRKVMDAANLLNIREIDFFRLAYRRWRGSDASEQALERVFADYMFHQTVPPWVRHLSREVNSQHSQGTLDAERLGANYFRRRLPPPPENATLSLVLFAAAMAIFFALLLNDAPNVHSRNQAAGVGRSVTDCRPSVASPFMEKWVYLIAGKSRPVCGDGLREIPVERR